MRSVERRLERLVDGAVGRFFRGGVRPVEIGHRLVREMADSRSVGVKGQSVVANHFEVQLNETDLARFADVEESLVRELCEAAREAARDDGWNFMGPVQVVLTESTDVRPGQMRIDARMKEADGATGVLHLSNGQQVVLGEYRLTFGRLPECTVTFDDTNVSREHARSARTAMVSCSPISVPPTAPPSMVSPSPLVASTTATSSRWAPQPRSSSAG